MKNPIKGPTIGREEPFLDRYQDWDFDDGYQGWDFDDGFIPGLQYPHQTEGREQLTVPAEEEEPIVITARSRAERAARRARGEQPDRSGLNYAEAAPADEVVLSRDGYRTEKDPTLAGVNEQIRARIGARQSAGRIAVYLEQVQPGLGRELLGPLNETVAFRRQNPGVPMSAYEIRVDDVRVPLSATRDLLNDGAQSPFGAYALAAGDMVTAGNLDSMTENPALTRAAMGQIASDNPWSSAAGTIAGGALTSELAGAGGAALRLGRAAPFVGDALYGAAYGAGSNDDSRLEGAILGGVSAGAATGAARKLIPEGLAVTREELATRPLARNQKLIEKYLRQGETPERAHYLAEPYDGRGEHLIPLKAKMRVINRRIKLPPMLSESRFNVLKPKGISRGDFYELHYRVDPNFHGARLPAGMGPGGWSGKKLGLKKYGPMGSMWHGTPRSLKAAVGVPAASGAAAYWYLDEDDE